MSRVLLEVTVILSLIAISSCRSPRQIWELTNLEKEEGYTLDLSQLVEIYPNTPKKIGLQFHFINNVDSTLNYNADQAPYVIQSLINAANERMQRNDKMLLPVGNNTPVLPTNISYYLNTKQDGSPDIHYHYELEPEYFVKRGKNNNVYKRSLSREYQSLADSIVRVFVQPFDPELLESGVEKLEQTAVALDNTMKLPGLRQIGADGWAYAAIFNHEMGHILGLRHSWNEDDGCSDTPRHTNCWNTSTTPPCDTHASNNLMDYNAHQSAITPCQINKMHRTLSTASRQAYQLVKSSHCINDGSRTSIDRPTLWSQPVMLSGDLVIRKGATLKISSSLHMSQGSQIIIKNGGTLILQDATIYNGCLHNWGGLYCYPKGKVIALGEHNMLIQK